MVRVTNAVATLKSKRRMLKNAKGFWGDRKNHLRITQEAVVRAMAYNYTHRKLKKRDFRGLWIARLAAATKINEISYSKFIYGLKRANCELNRKVLSELAIHDPQAFAAVVATAKQGLV